MILKSFPREGRKSVANHVVSRFVRVKSSKLSISFLSGLWRGTDGLRPQHLKNMIGPIMASSIHQLCSHLKSE